MILKKKRVPDPLNTPQLCSRGLVTNYGEGEGGLQNGRGGGAREVLPLQKGGAEKSFSYAEGGVGHKKFWFSFYAVA